MAAEESSDVDVDGLSDEFEDGELSESRSTSYDGGDSCDDNADVADNYTAKCICPLCGKDCRQPCKLDVHVRKHTRDWACKCKLCGKTLASPRNLRHHLMAVHDGRREEIECSVCEKKFWSKALYERHRELELKRTCSVCGKVFLTPHKLERHMLVHTGERPFKCDICGKRLSSNCKLKAHCRRKHTENGELKCGVCKMVFLSYNSCEQHYQKHESTCSVCGRTFNTPLKLKAHMMAHSSGRFSEPSNLEMHCHIEHGQNSKTGTIMITASDIKHWRIGNKQNSTAETTVSTANDATCWYRENEQSSTTETSVSTASDTTTTTSAQAGKRDHTCPYCGKDCQSFYKLNRHIVVHDKERPYECDICRMRYTNKSGLRMHYFRAHAHDGKMSPKKTEYSANSGTPSAKKGEYTAHSSKANPNKAECEAHSSETSMKKTDYNIQFCETSTKETEEKSDFTRAVCSQHCSSKVCLEQHQYVHTGEKPFECSHCDMRFSRKYYLSNHLMTFHGDLTDDSSQEDEENRSCPVCGKVFSKPSDVRRHLKIHTDRKQCSICKECFSQSSALIEHCQKVHTKERVCTSAKDRTCKFCGVTFSTAAKLFTHFHHKCSPHYPCEVSSEHEEDEAEGEEPPAKKRKICTAVYFELARRYHKQ